MRIWCRAAFGIVCLGLGASACRTAIAGHYELDLEQTKACVAKAALDNPDDAAMKDQTLEMLEKTTVDVVLEETGKMHSTSALTDSAPGPQHSAGSWRAEDQRVLISIEGEADTLCAIDGRRLRCKKPKPMQLFTNYVLVRK